MSENNDIQNEELNKNEEIQPEEAVEKTENLAEEKSIEEILAEEKDKYIRLYAEFENFKRRTIKEKQDFFLYANQDIMTSLLGVLDDFQKALKDISQNGNEADLKGVELIYQKFKSKLVEKGLKPIEVKAGDDFNVDFHEAITQIPAPSDELKGKIIDVIEEGYILHDKVIRFAKVVTGQA